MSKGARGRRTGLAIGTALLAVSLARGAPAASLAGCYERVYDAAHLARHKGQLVVRARLVVGTGIWPNDPGDPNPIIADAALEVWVRGSKLSFHSDGVCWAQGQGLVCNGSLSAAEVDACKTKADGVRDCRIDWPGAAGSFRLVPKPEGVLLTIPERLEVPETGPDGGPPFLYLSRGNAENHAFMLKSALASVCK